MNGFLLCVLEYLRDSSQLRYLFCPKIFGIRVRPGGRISFHTVSHHWRDNRLALSAMYPMAGRKVSRLSSSDTRAVSAFHDNAMAQCRTTLNRFLDSVSVSTPDSVRARDIGLDLHTLSLNYARPSRLRQENFPIFSGEKNPMIVDFTDRTIPNRFHFPSVI